MRTARTTYSRSMTARPKGPVAREGDARSKRSVVILTAIDDEFKAVRGHLAELGRDDHKHGTIYTTGEFVGEFHKWKVALVEIGDGNDIAATETERAVNHFSPDVVLFVGVAGGVKDVALCDVVAAEWVYGYESGRDAETFKPRGKSLPCNYSLVQAARRVRTDDKWQKRIATPTGIAAAPKAFVKPIAAGEKVVADTRSPTYKFLRETYSDAVAVEMEGRGVLRAAHTSETRAVIVRGISDLIDNKELADSAGSQPAASAAAAAFAFELLSLLSIPSRDGGSDQKTDSSGWSEVTFTDQRDLGAALRGDSMGPADVLACPPIEEVDEIVRALDAGSAVAVVGPSGSGKSMAAWHAAHRFREAGWKVHVLAATPTSIPASGLLVVDDAQAYASPPVSPAVTNGERKLLAVSTDAIAGVRRTVRIIPESAVASVAAGVLDRAEELLPLLNELDPHVGPGAFDTSIERKVEYSKRTTTTPWQFMFALGSGHLRLDAALLKVEKLEPRDLVLFSIALRQLATMDRGCDITWLSETVRSQCGDVNLSELLDEVGALVPLTRNQGSVATPHVQVARRIVNQLFFGRGPAGEKRRSAYWAIFDDPTVPLGGLAWLVSEAPTHLYGGHGVPKGLVERVAKRCLDATDVGQAGYLLSLLVSRWGVTTNSLEPFSATIVAWFEAAEPAHALGLSRLVNELINYEQHDRDPPGTPERMKAAVIVCRTSAVVVARWASAMNTDKSAGQAELLQRLSVAATDEWCDEVKRGLDHRALLAAVSRAGAENLWTVDQIVLAVLSVDRDLGFELARAASGLVVEVMRRSALEAYESAHEIFWAACGLVPKFLRGSYSPSEAQLGLAREIVAAVGAKVLAAQLSTAPRKDWHSWANLIALIGEASPTICREMGELIDPEPLAVRARETERPEEIDNLITALALTGDYEPGASVARRVYTDRMSMSSRAAYIAPDAALEVLGRGGKIPLPIGGGLPQWRFATAVVVRIARLDAALAARLLEANTAALADGLVFRQSNGGDGMQRFLSIALEYNRDAVRSGLELLEFAAVQPHWSARMRGAESERESMRAIGEAASRVGSRAADFLIKVGGGPGGATEQAH